MGIEVATTGSAPKDLSPRVRAGPPSQCLRPTGVEASLTGSVCKFVRPTCQMPALPPLAIRAAKAQEQVQVSAQGQRSGAQEPPPARQELQTSMGRMAPRVATSRVETRMGDMAAQTPEGEVAEPARVSSDGAGQPAAPGIAAATVPDDEADREAAPGQAVVQTDGRRPRLPSKRVWGNPVG